MAKKTAEKLKKKIVKAKPKKKVVKKKSKVSAKKKIEKPVKKHTEKPTVKKAEPAGKLIGKISHYFSHIGVAVVELSGTMSVGDNIRIVGGEDTDFNQIVSSMEEDRVKLEKATAGQGIGLKVKERVREGYKVYKL